MPAKKRRAWLRTLSHPGAHAVVSPGKPGASTVLINLLAATQVVG